MRCCSLAQVVQTGEEVRSSPSLLIRVLSVRQFKARCVIATDNANFQNGSGLRKSYNGGMIANIVWLSLAKAAEYLDVSKDTVLRRAVEWTDEPVPGKVRTKYLVLGADTRQDRRYYLPDLERWLSARAQTTRGHIKGHFAPA